MPAIVSALLTEAAARLAGTSPTPRLDAEVLLAHALGRERGHLRAHPELPVDEVTSAGFIQLLDLRAKGQPVAYLTGRREFWSMELRVTPDTLIPRPETELLVEETLNRIPPDADWRVLDLGTGSGAIALALARERPHCRITATDVSGAALQVARENAASASNVELLHGHWFGPVAGRRFHVIVSNPPYIREDDGHLGRGDLRFEPRPALAAGRDGLEALRRIAVQAPRHLEPGGWLLLEHGYDQAAAVASLLRIQGFESIDSIRDLQEHERVTLGRWPGIPTSHAPQQGISGESP